MGEREILLLTQMLKSSIYMTSNSTVPWHLMAQAVNNNRDSNNLGKMVVELIRRDS